MSARRANGDGTAAAQRKDGTWYRTIVINGKRRYVYGRTESEVNKKFRNLKKEDPEVVARSIKYMTVEEYVTNWLITYKKVQLKPKSYDTLVSPILRECSSFPSLMRIFKNLSINSMMTGAPIPLSENHIWLSTAFINTP